MRYGSAKTTPSFDCNACDLYGELQSLFSARVSVYRAFVFFALEHGKG